MLYSRYHKGFKETPKQQELDLQEVDSGRKSTGGAAQKNPARPRKAKPSPASETSDGCESGSLLPNALPHSLTEDRSD